MKGSWDRGVLEWLPFADGISGHNPIPGGLQEGFSQGDFSEK